MIISDLKNAIRDAIYDKDNSINFNFNKIETVDFPYVFFYIPSYKLEAPVNEVYWRKVNLMCVLEYMEHEENSHSDLWGYAETLQSALYNFEFLGTRISSKNNEFRLVDDVLQFTFDLEFYVKNDDLGDLMQELEFTIKEY